MKTKTVRRIISIALMSAMVISVIGWYRVAAEPVDGKLGVNIAGGNWINPYTGPSLVSGVYNSGARWVFVTTVWFTFEPNPPTAPCPELSGTNDGYWYYYSDGPTGQCHTYKLADIDNMDRVIGGVPGTPYSGLKGNGHYVVMGQWAPPTWAGGGPAQCPGSQNNCAMVYRDHLNTFSDGAKDLARFLVTRYTPAAFSPWNEPQGYAYLSIQPDPARVYWTPAGYIWPAWQDYVTYLLEPISTDLGAVAPGVMIMGPELASSFNGAGDSYAQDSNWSGWWGSTVQVGRWVEDWTDYILRYYPSLVDRWTLHTYGDGWDDPYANVGATWNKMLQLGQTKYIWVTEGAMATGGCNKTQRSRANWICKVNQTQTWDQTFYWANDDDGCTDYSNPDAVTGHGLMGISGSYYPQKWLRQAFYAILVGAYYCS